MPKADDRNLRTVSQVIVDFLVAQKVTHTFLLTGGAISRIVDAMHDRDDINYVCMSHEQGASMAADGYSRLNPGSIGVNLTTSGPGFTNILTGVGCSWFDGIPSLHISGQVNTFESRQGRPVRQMGFQETDSVDIIRPITKFAHYLDDAEDILWALEAAVYWAKEGRPGPVFIDVPFDISKAVVEPEKLRRFEPPKAAKRPGFLTLQEGIEATKAALCKAERPVLLAGGGLRGAQGRALVTAFAEATGVPVVHTMACLAALPDRHPLNRGMVGVYGHREANWTIANSDLLLSVGSRLDSRQTGTAPQLFAREATKIVVDIDEGELGSSRVAPDVRVLADAQEFISGVTGASAGARPASRDGWMQTTAGWKETFQEKAKEHESGKPGSTGISPYAFCRALGGALHEGDVVALDTGQNLIWASQALPLDATQFAFTAGGMSPMGYSFPAAIGASFARGKGRAVAVIGDGGMQINIQELQTLAYHRLPIAVFVLNNRSLGLIRQFTDQNFEGRNAATNQDFGYSCPDFAKVAAAYDIASHRVTTIEELTDALPEIMRLNGPVLVDVMLDQTVDALPKLSVHRPVEEQEPELPEEMFEQMIVARHRPAG